MPLEFRFAVDDQPASMGSVATLTRQRARDQLMAEIKFLTEQYRDTGHPSIPVKLSNARLKLEKLIGTDDDE